MEKEQELTVSYGPNVDIKMPVGGVYIAIAVGEEVGKWIQQLEYNELQQDQKQYQKAVYFILYVQICKKALGAGLLLQQRGGAINLRCGVAGEVDRR